MNPGVGIHGDRRLEGVDIAAAIFRVPARDGEFEQVDIAAGQDILLDLASLDLDRFDPLGQVVTDRQHHVPDRGILGQAQRHGDTGIVRHAAGKHLA